MGILHLNYEKAYNNLIQKHGLKEKPDYYVERHHVIPKCMGGPDTADNIVYLTARCHFLAHWLLYKIHGTHGLSTAWFRTAHSAKTGEKIVNSKHYEIVKIKMAEEMSIKYSGKGNPMYGKSWNKGKTGLQDYSRMKGTGNPRSRYTYLVTKPDGTTEITETITQFCKDHDISYQHLGKVARGIIKQHKGYKAIILEDRNVTTR